MKTLHIIPKEVFESHHRCFSESHYIDLPDEKVLVCGRFRDSFHRDEFTSHPQVSSLAHPLSGETLSREHAAVLQHLGASEKDTAWSLSKKLKAVHPLMDIS